MNLLWRGLFVHHGHDLAFIGGVLVTLAGPLFAPIPEGCRQPCDYPETVRLVAVAFIRMPVGFIVGRWSGIESR